MLPDLDSNQDYQSQNLKYYRYTIGQSFCEPCGTKLEPLFSGFKAVVRTLNKKYTQNTTIQYADFQYLRYDTIAYQFAVRSLIIPYTFESGTHK